MKGPWLLVLMMSWAASADSTGYARVFHERSEPLASKAREEAAADRPGDGARNPRGEGDEARGGHPEQERNGPVLATRGAPKSRPSQSFLKPPSHGPLHSTRTQAHPGFRVGTGGTAIDSRPTPSPSTVVPGGMIDHDRRSVRSSVAVALNGQQFKNAHNPGASLAIRAGTANSIGGAAAVNGTDMKPKP